MTTKLNKPVHRETSTTVRDRSKRRVLIAGLLPGDLIQVRLKGCRKAYALTVEQVYYYAAKLEGEAALRAKRAAKKARAVQS